MIDSIGLRLILSIVLFLGGIYLLICAITVKGSVYSNSTLHHTKYYNKYIKLVRIFCFILFGMFTLNTASNWWVFYLRMKLTAAEMPASVFDVLYGNYVTAYNTSVYMLYVSIVSVMAMIFTAVYFTNKCSLLFDDSLSDSHPAFRNKKND